MKRLLLIAIALVGCGTTPTSFEQARKDAADIQYVSDPRSGVCFAMLRSKTYGPYTVTSIATIPCERMPK